MMWSDQMTNSRSKSPSSSVSQLISGQRASSADHRGLGGTVELVILDEHPEVGLAQAVYVRDGVIAADDLHPFELLDAVAHHLLGEADLAGQLGQALPGIERQRRQDGAVLRHEPEPRRGQLPRPAPTGGFDLIRIILPVF